MEALLSITDLHTCFNGQTGVTHAVNGVTLSIKKGQIVALVGESGSGKSMTALSVIRLVPEPGRITAGSVKLEDNNLLELSDKAMRMIRGRKISMIFQEPMTSLNPVLRIGDQVSEPLIIHRNLSKREAFDQSIGLLQSVGISSASERVRDYPHQLSGGMRQRVMIAMALACNPALLIADEPTTALDVTIQAQILELIETLRTSSKLGILLITHDLGIVSERSDHTCVMYAGRIVEEASTSELFANPRHPYTLALLDSLPQNSEPGRPLNTIGGQMPDLSLILPGCGFCDRCPVVRLECRHDLPNLNEISPGHKVRCWL